MRRRQRLSLTGGLEGSGRQSLEDPDRGAQADRLFRAGTVMRRRGARSPTTVRGSSPGSPARPSSCAPRSSSAALPTTSIVAACDEPGCAGERMCTSDTCSTSPGHNLSLLMRQLIGAGTPREAVAGGYGGIFVLLTPTGAMLVARGVSKSGQTAFAAAFLIWG